MKVLVDASWDDEAHVWVATTQDDIGLVTEADTIDELRHKLSVILPDLMGEEVGPFETQLRLLPADWR